jgi:hypothetical protein
MTIPQQQQTALRQAIKARAKALRADIDANCADQQAAVEREINVRYEEQKALYGQANSYGRGVVAEANARLQKVYEPLVGDHPEWGGFAMFMPSQGPDLERQLMRARARKEVDAAAKQAEANLVRWEAKALEAVALLNLGDEAKALLAEVADVSQIMPAVKIADVAAAVVEEMARTGDKVPYRGRGEEPYELRARRRELAQHARQWLGREGADPKDRELERGYDEEELDPW